MAKKILITEDDEGASAFLCEVAASLGYDACAVNNGLDCMKYVKTTEAIKNPISLFWISIYRELAAMKL